VNVMTNFSIYGITKHKKNRPSVQFISFLTSRGSSCRSHFTTFCSKEEPINTEVMVHNGRNSSYIAFSLNLNQ